MGRHPGIIVLAAAVLSSCSAESTQSPAAVVRLDLSLTGRYLAAADAAGRVWIMDRSSGRRLRQARIEGPVNDLRFSPNEAVLAIAARDLSLWNHESSQEPRSLTSDRMNYGTAVFLASGNALLTITGGGTIRRIDIASGMSVWSQCCTSIYGEAAASPSQDYVVTAGHLPRAWNAQTGSLLGALVAERSDPAFGPVAFAPGGKSVWIGCQDGILRQWDIATRVLMKSLPAQPGWIESIAASPDGATLAFTVRDRGIHLWRGTIRLLSTLGPTSNIVFEPGGERIVAGTRDGRLALIPLDGGMPAFFSSVSW